MSLDKLKQMALYQTFVRPLVWSPIRISRHYRKIRQDHVFRSFAEEESAQLSEARNLFEHLYAEETNPLVSIMSPTYNRGQLLIEKTIPAVLSQTHQNLEYIIIGDHCGDNTPELLAGIKDPRIRFYDLPERPRYPKNKIDRWRCVGASASNTARGMARGSWIAYLDDDDVCTPDHIEALLHRARSGNYEFVSGRLKLEKHPGEWIEKGEALTRDDGSMGHVCHSTILYRSYLRFFKYDSEAWKLGIPGDAHLFRRMRNAGVRAGFANRVVTLAPLRPGERARSIFQPE